MVEHISKKYFLIDNDLIIVDLAFPFDIYRSREHSQKVEVILRKGVKITHEIRDMLKQVKALYVFEEHRELYNIFCKKYLKFVNQQKKSFSDKSKDIYEDASNVMLDLFENPSSSAAIEKGKEVVNNLVDVVLDEDYSIVTLLGLIAQDYAIHTHSINVSVYALSLGKSLDLNKKYLTDLGTAALFHDLGKSKLDKSIVYKNAELTMSEAKIMESHPVLGYRLALNMGLTDKKVLAGIKYHHERLDGSGYPDSLIGNKIPVFARVIAICDEFDQMTTRKSFEDATSTYNTFVRMKKFMAKKLDMSIVDKFILGLRG